ncbi:phytanoyl-CoA dioxygenase family protein [Kordiimonas gwangyangensis]|uniref:phytanoyl-CoA dioxygenase family protein n=1 Tax=Kordiimonas gwangyangensis TaxID=288022 RepID=UPI000375B231|nr:phytanoyl-CoA dioxygenase family protein [Kordiimonas gwangyangensis]
MARNVFAPDGSLVSPHWFDKSTAHEILDQKILAGEISGELTETLHFFVDNGYCIYKEDVSDTVLDVARDEIEQLLADRPSTVLAASVRWREGRPQPLSWFPKEIGAAPGFRVLDAHSHAPQLARLISLKKMHSIIRALLGEAVVATQSLYFTHGSTQNLHRDPWYVITNPVSNLLAAWIALEDITEESGPLTFVPGSHTIPYLPLNTGDIIFHDPAATLEAKADHHRHMQEEITRRDLKIKKFLAKKGEVLIWHASLLHGGSTVLQPELTRSSFVVHFDCLKAHNRHAQTLKLPDGSSKVLATHEIVNRNGSLYYDNPLVEASARSFLLNGNAD